MKQINEEKMNVNIPYHYMQINSSTSLLDTPPHFIYLCMRDGCDQFKKDTEALGLETHELLMNGTRAVVAIDTLKPISFELIQSEILDSEQVEDKDGPFPSVRTFTIPVYFEMWASQKMTASNMVEAMTKIWDAPLPQDAGYVDESFHIDEEGDISLV